MLLIHRWVMKWDQLMPEGLMKYFVLA